MTFWTALPGLIGAATSLLDGDDIVSEQASTMTPEQRRLLQQMVNILNPETGGFGPQNIDHYDGPLGVGLTPGEQLSLNGLEQFMNGRSQAEIDFLTQGAGKLSEFLSLGPDDIPYFKPSVSAMDAYNAGPSALSALEDIDLTSMFESGESRLKASGTTVDMLNSTPGIADLIAQLPSIAGSVRGGEQVTDYLASLGSQFDTGTQLLSNNNFTAATDKYFADTVQDPMLHQFETEILPRISRNFSNDFFSSDRQDMDQRSRDALLRALTSERGRLGLLAAQQEFEGDQLLLGAKGDDLNRALTGKQSDLARLLQGLISDNTLSAQGITDDRKILADASRFDLDRLADVIKSDTGHRSNLAATQAQLLANAAASDAATRTNAGGTTAQNELGGYVARADLLKSLADIQLGSIDLGVDAIGSLNESQLNQAITVLEAMGLPREVQERVNLLNAENFNNTQERLEARLRTMLQVLGQQGVENLTGVDEGVNADDVASIVESLQTIFKG